MGPYDVRFTPDTTTQTALVHGSVPEHFMTEPFNFFFQMRLAAAAT